MEYNLVAEQPKGIKLELQEAESIPTPRLVITNLFDLFYVCVIPGRDLLFLPE